MTNETDLRECSSQIELVRQLIDQPETFDLNKVLTKLETKKKLLVLFKPRSYAAILRDIEAGFLKHPGDWAFEEIPEEPKIDKSRLAMIKEAQKDTETIRKENAAKTKKEAEKVKKEAEEKAQIEKEIQITKDKLAELKALKELEKEEEAEIIEEKV